VAHLYGGIVAWLLGEPELARNHVGAGLELARALDSPGSVAQALRHASVVYQLCGDHDRVIALTDELAALSAAYDVPMWPVSGKIINGWAIARAGKRSLGLAQIRDGLAELEAAGVALIRPYHLALLAESLPPDDADEALQAVSDALHTARGPGELWYEAELVRLRGECLFRAQRGEPLDHEAALDATEPSWRHTTSRYGSGLHRFNCAPRLASSDTTCPDR
jgi:predicted ATPase